jgi:hypothetical protein
MVIAYAGRAMLNINIYDQPAVELGKRPRSASRWRDTRSICGRLRRRSKTDWVIAG